MPAARNKMKVTFKQNSVSDSEIPSGASSHRIVNTSSWMDTSVRSSSRNSTPWNFFNGHQGTSQQSNGPSTISMTAWHRNHMINMASNVTRSHLNHLQTRGSHSRAEATLNSSTKRRLEDNKYSMPAGNQKTHHTKKKKNVQKFTKKRVTLQHIDILHNRNENHNSSQLQETVEPKVEPSQLPDIINISQLDETVESSQLQQTVEPSQLQEIVDPRRPLQVEVSGKIDIFYAFEDGLYFADEFPGEKISFKEFKDFIAREGNYGYYFKMTDEENGYIFKRIADDERLLPIINGKLYCKIHRRGTLA